MTVFPIKYKTRVFKIRGGDIDCSHDNIAVDESTGLLHVSTSSTISPIHKTAKISTPTKSVHKKLFSDMPLTGVHSFVRTDSMESEYQTSLSEETAVSIDPVYLISTSL